ncbi:hypothetical protein LHFGNBLO_006589 (plasmid) [Mesorhizobium sp. AR10]|uniref:hypothetical protein n=1 Tax=Mesorhizobium sp. AR10 TaxID=2865839 RepID=UPI0021604E2C|nr:hypothetical protein [Mesorhizobium sp. AR10]UVK35725.1 hypothetical protein LHFGNBLO_006589 [Mesorhizobium sp. AR10]
MCAAATNREVGRGMAMIKAKNVTAELQFRGRGNPPAAHPQDAVGNFFPGLEFNFQNVWKRFFVGLEVLEHGAQVTAVNEDEVSASGGDIVSPGPDPVSLSTVVGAVFIQIDGKQTWQQMAGPLDDPSAGAPFILLEWSNMLAEVHAAKGGTDQTVACFFQRPEDQAPVGPFRLKVRRLLEPDSALIKRETSLPGEITESLCSPWQTDYIGCACYYWASNRPDYVNITDPETPDVTGNNWLDTARLKKADGKPLYTLVETNLLQHEDVMQDWESKFQFIVKGKDAPDGLGS